MALLVFFRFSAITILGIECFGDRILRQNAYVLDTKMLLFAIKERASYRYFVQ